MRHPVVPHVLRTVFWALVLVVIGSPESALTIAFTAVASGALFLACFAFFHDAAHGSLGLSRRVNDALLFVLSAPLFMATHAQRQLHLRHHARPLERDDVEGVAARLSFLHALVAAPLLAGAAVSEGVRAVPSRLRPLVVVELAAVIALACVAIAMPVSALAVYVAVACVLQLSMAFWASHIPHNPPALVRVVARRLASLGSPAVLSLAFHLEHHARPRVPCAKLG